MVRTKLPGKWDYSSWETSKRGKLMGELLTEWVNSFGDVEPEIGAQPAYPVDDLEDKDEKRELCLVLDIPGWIGSSDEPAAPVFLPLEPILERCIEEELEFVSPEPEDWEDLKMIEATLRRLADKVRDALKKGG